MAYAQEGVLFLLGFHQARSGINLHDWSFQSITSKAQLQERVVLRIYHMETEWIGNFAALVALLAGSTGELDPAKLARNNSADDIVPLIVIEDVPLTAAIRNLARQAEINIIFDPRVPGSDMGAGRWKKEPNISARWEDIRAADALLALLKEQKLAFITNSITGVARIAPAHAKIRAIQTSPVSHGSNAVAPLTVIQDVPLADALKYTAKSAGWRVLFEDPLSTPEFEGTVYIRWENITATQALLALVDNYYLEMEEDPQKQVIRIRRKRS